MNKMKAVGHLEITGTLGNDCSYIRMFATPTGRKIVFATTRQIRMAEAWTDSNSMSYDLTAGVLEFRGQPVFGPRESLRSTGKAERWTRYAIGGRGVDDTGSGCVNAAAAGVTRLEQQPAVFWLQAPRPVSECYPTCHFCQFLAPAPLVNISF
jgi:hypothetical protein